MAKKMLIDATHVEETRVVVVDGNKVEEFDFETQSRRQLAGNIYLAKVMRVEPSLQAAFVDYGGNRHGFLAFSEIHPGYYQIPVADRDALLAEEAAYAESLKAEADEEAEQGKPSGRRGGNRGGTSRTEAAKSENDDAVASKDPEIAGMETIEPEAGQEPRAEGDEDPRDSGDVSVAEAEGGSDAAEPAESATGDEAAAAAPKKRSTSGRKRSASKTKRKPAKDAEAADVEAADDKADVAADAAPADDAPVAETADADTADADAPDAAPEAASEEAPKKTRSRSRGRGRGRARKADPAPDEDDSQASQASDGDDGIESVADEDDSEDIRPRRKPRMKRYKIQEVVKVRQILLVQVVKEERGNKGAALTTYLSLAGRYCVLMPNTARGGGISRKITNAADRKKLKQIAAEIDVPEGAGLIIRTAGSQRTKSEIKRDYEYLQRLWEQIRELTLKSIAPAPIYEEGNLIKRTIRDLYNKEIDEVIVEGDAGYRTAKDFMKMIMPSHAKNVKHYTDQMPLFARYQVESYLTGMFNPTVQLPSGGYIVIGVTEALVAIDVNSGRATKEGSIEQTALKTNLEAAEEVARQLRLRDLAGLIVIDFIDMDERRNNTAVEKRLKDRLKTDRARIQVGKISGFGLLEMSRQRLRPGMIEATTQPCPHCHGTGLLRSDDNVALAILRQLEEEGVRGRCREVLVKVPVAIANYLINQKREHVAQIEARYGLSVRIEAVFDMVSPDYALEKFKTATRAVAEPAQNVVSSDMGAPLPEDEAEDATAPDQPEEAPSEDEQPRKRRRRRSRRKKRPETEAGEAGEASADEAAQSAASEGEAEAEAPVEAAEAEPKPKRSRSRSRKSTKTAKTEPQVAPEGDSEAEAANGEAAGSEASAPEDEAPKPKRRRSRSRKPKAEAAPADEAAPAAEVAEAAPAAEPVEAAPVAEPDPAPEVAAEAPADGEDAPAAAAAAEPEPEAAAEAPEAPEPAETAKPAETPDDPSKPKRRGWWSLGR